MLIIIYLINLVGLFINVFHSVEISFDNEGMKINIQNSDYTTHFPSLLEIE